MKKSMASLLAVGMSATLVLSACGNNNSNEPGNTPNQSGEDTGPVTINLFRQGEALPAPDKDIILPELNKALNMDLKYNTAPTEYDQQLNVKIAGGNPPDVFGVSKVQMEQFVEQDILLDLTPYLASMNHLTPENGFTETHMKKGVVDGKQYAIPYRPLIPVQTTFWVRQDWLDKLNLQAPKTIDELKAVAKAFVEKDPDGNGVNDTIGITGNGFNGTLSPLFAAFGVAAPGQMMIRDNKVVYSTELPETEQAVTFINGMINEKLIDPEFLTNNGLMHQEKAFKGQAGIVYAHWAHMKRPDMVEKMNAINPNQEWTQLDAMTGPGGKFADFFDEGGTNLRLVIPKSLESEPKKVEKVLEYINYVSGGDGQTLVNFGIEDRNYKVVDGQIEIIEAGLSEMGHASIHQTTGRVEMEYLNTKFRDLAPYFEFTNKLPYISVYTNFVSTPEGVNPADKTKFEEEEMIKFVYGKRPVSEMGDFIKTLRGTFQLDKYLQEAEKSLRELEFIK
ncbi:extracellular solute-binding protein [Paenibacillus sp. PAMC21692]|uniref:extracellular solute-binding protein n=1 Tax=Paenibacillus sp. PAMC21692 TaxID=2762320 RepID=UPI00164DCFDA|nr:extracellular solute-binding protein [Paenibacillus sp. PAMC21692]QNK57005.1 extracellular solute-binding protein [Paenibacillus sp. PAMC21692]